MAARGLARVGDPIAGTCTLHDGPTAYTGNWSNVHSPSVYADGIAVIRVGDTTPVSCGHIFTALAGSTGTTCDGAQGFHRVGDPGTTGGGTGTTIAGSTNVDSL